MIRTILLSNHYEGKPLEILKEAVGSDFILKTLHSVKQEELNEVIRDADYLIASGRLEIGSALLANASRLKMVQRTGVGIDHIDIRSLKNRGIPLYINSGINANSVAEYTVMLMLSALKRSYAVNLQMRKGVWKKQETAVTTHEMAGKTVGIIGMGNIGRRVAQMLSGFNVEIIYTDTRRLSEEDERFLNVSYRKLDELLGRSHIVSLHCPYHPEHGYMIADYEISLMKEGSIIVNTARGKLLKTSAVIDAINKGKISAVGIDVFEEEPLDDVCIYAGYDDAMLSPHIAGLSYEAFERMIQSAVCNIRAFDREDYDSIASYLYVEK